MCTFSGDIVFSNDLFPMLASQRVPDCVIDFSFEVLARNCDCRRRQFEDSPELHAFPVSFLTCEVCSAVSCESSSVYDESSWRILFVSRCVPDVEG